MSEEFMINLNCVEVMSRRVVRINDNGDECIDFQYRNIERNWVTNAVISDSGWLTSGTVVYPRANCDSNLAEKIKLHKFVAVVFSVCAISALVIGLMLN